MKKFIKCLVFLSLLICAPFFIANVSGDNPPPPGPGPGEGDLPVGDSAPIGGGLIILATLGVAYGSKKIYDARNKLME